MDGLIMWLLHLVLWVLFIIASVPWTMLAVWMCNLAIAAEYREYWDRMQHGVRITPCNAWLIMFGAEVITPPNTTAIRVSFMLLWLMVEMGGLCILLNWRG